MLTIGGRKDSWLTMVNDRNENYACQLLGGIRQRHGRKHHANNHCAKQNKSFLLASGR